jgi:endonuclease G, mitochondrial
MKLTEALMRRAEEALTFDPRDERRALLDRTAVAVADPETLRRRIVQALGEGSDAAQLAVDRLVTGSDQLNVNYLERGMIAADAVARLEVRDGESAVVGRATGFMISSRLLATNHHVLPTADDAAQSWVHFRSEFDALGRSLEPCVFALEPSTFFYTDRDLDVSVVAVAEETPDRRQRVARFGWLRLSSSADTIVPGEWLTMVHHPSGKPKQVVLRQNLLIRRDDEALWYATETASGSSGAPIFNDSWQVVGLHRVGAPARDRAGRILTVDGAPWLDGDDESRIVWRAGAGTRSCAILQCLAEANREHPLINELFAHSNVDANESIVIPLGAGVEGDGAARPEIAADSLLRAGHTAHHTGNGGPTHDASSVGEALTVTVPLRITVRQGDEAGREPALGVNLS